MSDVSYLEVFRFNPSLDAAPYFEEYAVPWGDSEIGSNASVLQCLSYICENITPIAFDSSCESGLCGRCAMTINGSPALACRVTVSRGEKYRIEPLKGAPVVRDLIVDKYLSYEGGKTGNGRDVVGKVNTADIGSSPAQYAMKRAHHCCTCMCCYAVCPKMRYGHTERFIGPGAMAQLALRFLDSNDGADRVRQAVLLGIDECDLCGDCAMVCPAEIDIPALLAALKTEARKSDFSDGSSAGAFLRIPSSDDFLGQTLSFGVADQAADVRCRLRYERI